MLFTEGPLMRAFFVWEQAMNSTEGTITMTQSPVPGNAGLQERGEKLWNCAEAFCG